MLTPFVIDPEALEQPQEQTPEQIRDCYAALFECWEQAGLIVYDGDSLEHSRLYQAVRKLPQRQRLTWLSHLAKLPRRAAGGAWSGQELAERLPALAESGVLLALIANQAAERQAFAGGAASPEIRRIGDARRAAVFFKARQDAASPIPSGSRADDIWEQRFRTLAQAGLKRIAIVDRLALQIHFDSPRHSGLLNFLTRLAAAAGGLKHVTVYSAEIPLAAADIETELQAVCDALPNRSIDTLSLNIIPDPVFAIAAPDSFIRFENYVWDIGCGLRLFSYPETHALTLCGFKGGAVIEAYRRIERHLDAQRLVKLSCPPLTRNICNETPHPVST